MKRVSVGRCKRCSHAENYVDAIIDSGNLVNNLVSRLYMDVGSGGAGKASQACSSCKPDLLISTAAIYVGMVMCDNVGC